MLTLVPTPPRSLDDYRRVVGDAVIEELLALAAPLRGMRVLHVNSTAFGGGVAEILRSLVPLMVSAGLRAQWQLLKGSEEFFAVTKAMHNALQGMSIGWSAAKGETWLRYNRLNAELLEGEYDFVVLHDPQTAGLLALKQALEGRRPGGLWVWRCHIHMAWAQAEVWDFLQPYVQPFDAVIFTLRDYIKEGLGVSRVAIMAPAIDPLSPKNADLPPGTAADILQRYGVDPSRPLLLQVSRFDVWKDPLGVIDVYEALKRDVPGIQLAYVASMADDDPEAWAWLERMVRRAGDDRDVHILSNLQGVGDVEVNAFQRLATVVLQKSLREGFGLSVAEALWKQRPVVASNVGGIPLQVISDRTGCLADGTEEFIRWGRHLLAHPQIARRLGRQGQEHVRQHFLVTRYLRDYLVLFRGLLGEAAAK